MQLSALCVYLCQSNVFTTFPRAVRVRMQSRCHVWPWLNQFSSVALICFTRFSWTIFTNVSLKKINGRLVEPVAHGNIVGVVGQETCQYPNDSNMTVLVVLSPSA